MKSLVRLPLTLAVLSSSLMSSMVHAVPEALTGVAAVLDNVAQNPAQYPNLIPLVDNLALLPTEFMAFQALATVVPISDGSLMAASLNNVSHGIHNTGNRMEAFRLGIVKNGDHYAAGDWDTATTGWFKIYGNSLHQKKKETFEGYHAWNSGFTLGADKEFARNLSLGLAFNYAYTEAVSKAANKSEMDIQTFQGILYSSLQLGRSVYVDKILSVSYHDYNTTRFVVIPGSPGYAQRADGDFGAWQSTLWSEIGYEWLINHALITPYMNLQFSHTRFDSIQERGNAVNLMVDYDTLNEFVLGGGLRFGFVADMDSGVTIMPSVFAEANHDFIHDTQQSTARFIGGGASFVTPGLRPDPTGYRAGLAVELAAEDQWAVALSYDYEFRHRFHRHGAFMKLRYEWA